MTHFVPQYQPPTAGAPASPVSASPHAAYGSNPFGSAMNPDGSMVMAFATDYFSRNVIDQGKERLSAIETSEIRRRFVVTHEYVLQKLKILAFPFRHKFHRADSSFSSSSGVIGDETPPGLNGSLSAAGSSSNTCPANDINAPDLYLPLMALITYVVLCAFGKGLTATQLAPGDLATTVTACTVLIALETAAVKLWRMVTALPPPILFDTVALFGYFFVSVCFSLVGRVLFYAWLPPLSWLISTYNLAAFAFFMYKSLGETFMKDGTMPKRAIPILYGATLVQLPLFLWFVARAY